MFEKIKTLVNKKSVSLLSCHPWYMWRATMTLISYVAGGHFSVVGVLVCLSRVWLYGYYILMYICPDVINPLWARRRYNEILMVMLTSCLLLTLICCLQLLQLTGRRQHDRIM